MDLIDAAIASTVDNRRGVLIFATATLYVLTATFSVSGMELLTGDSSIMLPLLNSNFPLPTFLWAAPIIILCWHFFVLRNLSQHVELLQKLPTAWHSTMDLLPAFILNSQICEVQERALWGDGAGLSVTRITSWISFKGFPAFALAALAWRFSAMVHLGWTFIHCVVLAGDIFLSSFLLPLELSSGSKHSRGTRTFLNCKWAISLSPFVFLILFYSTINVDQKSYDGSDWRRYAVSLFPSIVIDGQTSSASGTLRLPLAHRKLFRLVVRNLDLKNMEISDAVVLSAAFENVNLTGTLLENVTMPNATFTNINFSSARWRGACLAGAKFRTVYATNLIAEDKTDLSLSKLNQLTLVNSQFHGVDLSGATIERSEFLFSSFLNVKFIGAHLFSVSSMYTNYSSQFWATEFNFVKWFEGEVKGSNFDGNYFFNTRFGGVNLKEAMSTANVYVPFQPYRERIRFISALELMRRGRFDPQLSENQLRQLAVLTEHEQGAGNAIEAANPPGLNLDSDDGFALSRARLICSQRSAIAHSSMQDKFPIDGGDPQGERLRARIVQKALTSCRQAASMVHLH